MNEIFKYRFKKGAERTIKWILFVIIIPLTPLIANFLTLSINNPKLSIYLFAPHGELLLFSIFINTSAIGDLLSNSFLNKILRYLLGGLALFLLVLCFHTYLNVLSNNSLNVDRTFNLCLELFIYSIINGFLCIIVAEI